MDDISVLVCDDSALMRNVISRVIDGSPGMKVVDKAMNGQILIDKIQSSNPDVVILDIEMPVMTGIDYLRYRKQTHGNVPVIILSSIAEKGAAVTMEALELGASDFITKPNGSVSMDINAVSDKLVEMVASYGGAFARAKGKKVCSTEYYQKLNAERAIERKLATTLGVKPAEMPAKPRVIPVEADIIKPPVKKAPVPIGSVRDHGKIEIIAIGISTGGPNALREVLRDIDPNIKQPILIVQHMPAGFTKEFASSLDRICPLHVKEAEDGDAIVGGTVYIAPGDYHIEISQPVLGRPVIRTTQSPQRNGHRPSADVLFESVARNYGNRSLGVIMTGMGKDGAVELAEMRKQGAWTIGQDEQSAIVYGMPRVAWELGAVQKQVSLDKMAEEISTLARENC